MFYLRYASEDEEYFSVLPCLAAARGVTDIAVDGATTWILTGNLIQTCDQSMQFHLHGDWLHEDEPMQLEVQYPAMHVVTRQGNTGVGVPIWLNLGQEIHVLRECPKDPQLPLKHC